jgi:hypothetical protein
VKVGPADGVSSGAQYSFITEDPDEFVETV